MANLSLRQNLIADLLAQQAKTAQGGLIRPMAGPPPGRSGPPRSTSPSRSATQEETHSHGQSAPMLTVPGGSGPSGSLGRGGRYAGSGIRLPGVVTEASAPRERSASSGSSPITVTSIDTPGKEKKTKTKKDKTKKGSLIVFGDGDHSGGESGGESGGDLSRSGDGSETSRRKPRPASMCGDSRKDARKREKEMDKERKRLEAEQKLAEKEKKKQDRVDEEKRRREAKIAEKEAKLAEKRAAKDKKHQKKMDRHNGVMRPNQLDPESETIPLIVQRVIDFLVESNKLGTEGIFRVSGRHSEVLKIKADFDQGIDVDLSAIKDVNDITGALKLYFRELPEPLLTFQLYEAFMTATAVENPADRLRCISEVLKRLPPGNLFVLRFLMQLLVKVAAQESHNKMGPGNLAVVFAPGLLRPERETMDMVFGKVTSANSLFETFIVDFDTLFGHDSHKDMVEQPCADSTAAFQTQEFEKALMRGTIRLASHMVLTSYSGDDEVGDAVSEPVAVVTATKKDTRAVNNWADVFRAPDSSSAATTPTGATASLSPARTRPTSSQSSYAGVSPSRRSRVKGLPRNATGGLSPPGLAGDLAGTSPTHGSFLSANLPAPLSTSTKSVEELIQMVLSGRYMEVEQYLRSLPRAASRELKSDLRARLKELKQSQLLASSTGTGPA
mmetsp:Transcript_40699/g.102431  ORF Transcript_40699/g.102431 Transcript_40699/m.102431 type:complete len:671 (+) Transcript_40699:126-2138(+)|eukprot:CAMPEP_0174242804 /NCGR_PEP_ID=MMETSP0417-20130205/29229_1 /TAXON_ID=242541 /ORGANISM="Mayorella sp, Strain BSH-02190019" /LENGTH=670 /DNA_ID=CAMNT_0015322239 /DNA_START=109 /DNA_END=2121 /DNA_ORIENTATION=+